MAGEHPLEAVAREACERLGQLLPRVPARVAKRGEPAALLAPGERVAGEEVAVLEEVDHASPGVPGCRDRAKRITDLQFLVPLDAVRRAGRCPSVVLVDPHASAERFGILVCVRDVVLVRKQDVRDAARALEELLQLARIARRIDEQVTLGPHDEVGMRAVGILRVEAAAVDAGRQLLGEDSVRAGLLRLAAHRRRRAHQHRAPGLHFLFGVRRLAREDAFVAALDDQAGCHVARRGAVDARRVDVPVARRRVGVPASLS